MAKHLTPDQVARYMQRRLSTAEFGAFDDHLATCEPCRQAVSDPKRLEAAYVFLRQDLQAQAKSGLTHISYEQLEAYVDDEISDADREIVNSHIELCPTCRTELRDLREFRLSLEPHDLGLRTGDGESVEPLTIFAQADEQYVTVPTRLESAREKLTQFWRYPGYIAAVSAAVAVVVIAALLLIPFHHVQAPNNGHGTLQVQLQPGEHSITVGKGTQVVPQELHPPAELNALIGKPSILLGGSASETSFALLTPVGTFVENAKPLFRWQPLSGASRYQVTVVDSKLREVLQSPEIGQTSWKSGRALQRGEVYRWQVTAFRDSGQIVAPAPPAPEARFEIIHQSQADELSKQRLAQASNHFALGCAYANAGVLDEAESELRLVPQSDANYPLAQKFLADVKALRPPGNPAK